MSNLGGALDNPTGSTIRSDGTGKITLQGAGATNKENLVVDTETTANTIALSSTTGVTDIRLTGMTINGTVYSAQMNDIVTGIILDSLTAPKLITNWKGTAAADSTESDWSGNVNTATYKNTTTARIIYKGFCKVFDPDGTDDYLTIADTDTLSFGNGANDSAVSMGGWVQIPTSTASTQIIMSKWNTDTTAREWQLTSVAATGVLRFSVIDESAVASTRRDTNAAPSVGWHFVVVTYDGTGGATALDGANCVVYIDGVVAASAATNNASYVAMENLTSPVIVAALGGSSISSFYAGDMGVLFVTGEELSAANIWKMYVRTKGYYAA